MWDCNRDGSVSTLMKKWSSPKCFTLWKSSKFNSEDGYWFIILKHNLCQKVGLIFRKLRYFVHDEVHYREDIKFTFMWIWWRRTQLLKDLFHTSASINFFWVTKHGTTREIVIPISSDKILQTFNLCFTGCDLLIQFWLSLFDLIETVSMERITNEFLILLDFEYRVWSSTNDCNSTLL